MRRSAATSAAPDPGRAAPIFAALGDEHRLSLIARLSSEGPLSISRLTEGTGVTRQAVTKHLRALEQVRLVRSAQHGRERLWHVTPGGLIAARRHLDAIAAQWDRALHRLKAAVERDR